MGWPGKRTGIGPRGAGGLKDRQAWTGRSARPCSCVRRRQTCRGLSMREHVDCQRFLPAPRAAGAIRTRQEARPAHIKQPAEAQAPTLFSTKPMRDTQLRRQTPATVYRHCAQQRLRSGLWVRASSPRDRLPAYFTSSSRELQHCSGVKLSRNGGAMTSLCQEKHAIQARAPVRIGSTQDRA